jgi:hypothetical protein
MKVCMASEAFNTHPHSTATALGGRRRSAAPPHARCGNCTPAGTSGTQAASGASAPVAPAPASCPGSACRSRGRTAACTAPGVRRVKGSGGFRTTLKSVSDRQIPRLESCGTRSEDAQGCRKHPLLPACGAPHGTTPSAAL